MDWYQIVKTLHIMSSTVLFGTGAGIAFFMLRSHFTDNVHEKYFAARNTVLADYIFTAPSVITQPLTGAWLVWQWGNRAGPALKRAMLAMLDPALRARQAAAARARVLENFTYDRMVDRYEAIVLGQGER